MYTERRGAIGQKQHLDLPEYPINGASEAPEDVPEIVTKFRCAKGMGGWIQAIQDRSINEISQGIYGGDRCICKSRGNDTKAH